MMEIYLGRRAVRKIRVAAREAMDEEDSEALPEEIFEAFPEETVEAIETVLDGTEFFEYLNATLEDWGRDDIDELFELLESQFAEIGIELSTEYQGDVDDTEVLEDENEFPAVVEFDDDL